MLIHYLKFIQRFWPLAFSVAVLGFAAAGARAQDIVIGQSAPLSGSNKELGDEIRNGALAYFNKVNEAGGVNGRKIQLVSLDDANNVERAAANAKTLIDDNKVLVLYGYASATLSRLAIPHAETAGVAFVSPFTGADPMRKFNRVVYNHRASYEDELEKIVNHYATVGVKNFGVLFHADVVGKENESAVVRALTKRNFKPAVLIGIPRVNPDIKAAAGQAAAARPDVMIVTTLAGPSADFIKAAKAANPGMQFASNSFSGPNVLLKALGKEGVGVTIAQVVPPVTNRTVAVVAEYQAAFEKLTGKKDFGATSLESFIAAKVLVEGIRRAGPKVDRASLMTALDGLKSFDTGGYVVSYAPNNHNGSSFTEITVITKDLRFGF